MRCNVGTTDRLLRIVLGLVIILAGLYFQSWWGLIGLIPLVTGALRLCPLYSVLGLSTCKTEEQSA